MKRKPLERKADPLWKRRDWVRFHGFASMHVWVSGGPIHAPHEPVLQLLIAPWDSDHESWTVYHHESDSNKDSKIVFKKWNYDADKARFSALGSINAPKDWKDDINIMERQFSVSGRWVELLEHAIERLSVPPIAGAIRATRGETRYRLMFWRGREKSEFSWNPSPPAGWRPLGRLFSSLLRNFRQHAEGRVLVLPAGQRWERDYDAKR